MVISKEKFKEIEERLYKHFITVKKLKCLESKALVLFKQKESVELNISTNNVNINADIRAVSYEKDNVQTSSVDSYMEKTLMKQIDNLEKEREAIIRDMLKTYTEIRELEKETFEINYILGLLKPECRELVKLKYDENKSFDEIAQVVNMSKSTAVRENRKIIQTIEKFLFNKGEI